MYAYTYTYVSVRKYNNFLFMHAGTNNNVIC